MQTFAMRTDVRFLSSSLPRAIIHTRARTHSNAHNVVDLFVDEYSIKTKDKISVRMCVRC